ncbi:DNA primase [Staphylococcus massiliensis]|uniref:DNA primase n=1 Tax=Staphylococcus massiliensis TaxID=555791 RepID=UPI001EDDA3FD|nr:DNA primase [Staphylococcus massiliensis]MCG3399006.1 DNA primase [Staphylococcus massiliensis]MCG3400996.1 DNA primase [Staphylococcus massiliensis]MCG3412531.1 DNA primase [Staphylococcus massiliensis]
MRIEQSVIDEIKHKTDIIDLVGEYVKLEKRGRNYIGLCPFHDEKTPSFTVSEDKQICHCFGCKKGGNAFQFLQEIEGLSFVDAVAQLGERVNVKVETNQSSKEETYASDDLSMIEMHELIESYYHYALLKTVEGEKALAYLKERGFTLELIQKLKIGYAPNVSHFCHDFLKKRGYDINLAYEAGLLSRNEENFSYYDRFRDRVMFPLKNYQGRTVGFSGRGYEESQQPKYLNSPESPIFQKRKLLYNLHQARRSIRKLDEMMVLEGFMDVIKANEAGVTNVVASMGTELSSDHFQVIRKLTSNVTLMYDGDKAGINATLKTGEALLKEHLNVFVITLPNGMDPDDYISKYGEETFHQYVTSNKVAFVSYKMRQYKDEIENNDLAYERYLKEITHDVGFMKSDLLRKKVLQEVAELFKVSFDSLNNEVVTHNHEPKSYSNHNQASNPKLSRKDKAERALLKHFMNDKDIFLDHHKSIESDDFNQLQFKRIFNLLHQYYGEYDEFILSDAFQYIEYNEDKDTLIYLDGLDMNYEPSIEEMHDYIHTMTEGKDTLSVTDIAMKIREAERTGDFELQKYYLEQLISLKRQNINH